MAELFDILDASAQTVENIVDVKESFPASVDVPEANTVQLRIQKTIEAGTYMFGLSLTHTNVSISYPAVTRFSLDGDTGWQGENEAALAFVGAAHYGTYQFPLVNHPGGAIDFIAQVRTKTGAGAINLIDVNYANIWLYRIG